MEIKAVSKSYGEKIVLDNVSISIRRNEIVGLVGNNGAGKSTLMKIMANTMPDYKGIIDEKSRIGYFIENPKLYINKSGLWHLKYFSSIFGEKFNLKEYENILKSIGLLEVLNRKVKTYSLGMKEKLGVMISMLNNPDFVILDEPTNGMDIESSLNFLNIIKKIAHEKNIGFLISSHKLEDIEEICDRILFLDNAKISEETCEVIESKFDVIIELKSDKDVEKFIENQKLGRVIDVTSKKIHLETTFGYTEIVDVIKSLNLDMVDYSSEKKTLRDIYIEKMAGRRYEKTV